MFVSRVCCVLCRERSLRRADHSSRGVRRVFVRACVRVCMRNLETSTKRRPFGLLRHRKYVRYLAIVCRPLVPI